MILRRPEITPAITESRISSEIEDTIKYGEMELSKEDIDAIEKGVGEMMGELNLEGIH